MGEEPTSRGITGGILAIMLAFVYMIDGYHTVNECTTITIFKNFDCWGLFKRTDVNYIVN